MKGEVELALKWAYNPTRDRTALRGDEPQGDSGRDAERAARGGGERARPPRDGQTCSAARDVGPARDSSAATAAVRTEETTYKTKSISKISTRSGRRPSRSTFRRWSSGAPTSPRPFRWSSRTGT